MKNYGYTLEELKEIKSAAIKFKKRSFFRLPGLLFGNKVAHRNPQAKIRNYSTITMCFRLSTGKWIYLIYAYPLSVIHRIFDTICKWATEKYCVKTISLKKWQQVFTRNSFIPTIPIGVKNLIAMPYIENENFFDLLAGRIGKHSFDEKFQLINNAVRTINEMHAKGITWAELLVHNMIYSLSDKKIILCDTETRYYRSITLVYQKASDWHDFIFSACGSSSKVHPEKVSFLAGLIFGQITDISVRSALKEICRKKKTLLHWAFFTYDWSRLSCSPMLYNQIKKTIVSLP